MKISGLMGRVVLRGAPSMGRGTKKAIAEWLRGLARDVEREPLAKLFTARYFAAGGKDS